MIGGEENKGITGLLAEKSTLVMRFNIKNFTLKSDKWRSISHLLTLKSCNRRLDGIEKQPIN